MYSVEYQKPDNPGLIRPTNPQQIEQCETYEANVKIKKYLQIFPGYYSKETYSKLSSNFVVNYLFIPAEVLVSILTL